MQMKRLGHVAVCVEDVPKAVQFYQNLGMKVVWQDSDWAYLKAGNDGLALMSPDYDQAGPHFGFVFDDRADIDTAYEKLKADGVKVGKIHDHRDGTASFYGRDPFGNWFEYLYEPDDLFGQETSKEKAVTVVGQETSKEKAVTVAP